MKTTQSRKATKDGKKAVVENVIEAAASVPAALIEEGVVADAAKQVLEEPFEAPFEIDSNATAQVVASEAPRGSEVQLLDLNLIVNSPLNPRKNFDEESLAELAESIRKVNVLQPICVRKNGEVFEIVYGERRYWAAVKAGLTHIPALVHEHLTDAEAEDLAITENLQREDISPLEEAAAFLRALKTGRHTVASLVDKFGKNEKYIRSHLKLNDLIEPLAELLEKEEIIESLAIELAKYPANIQQMVCREHFERDDYSSWKNTRPKVVAQYMYDRYMTKLGAYRFDKTECGTCPQNTANQVLFAELAKECAGCENRECMIRKNDEFLVRKAIRMQKDDPRILLAVESDDYLPSVVEELTGQGYTVEVINTYAMGEPYVPEKPDIEAPKEDEYDDHDEYLEALADYEEAIGNYRTDMQELDKEIDEGRVHKYALIGTLDVEPFYEELPEEEETLDEEGNNIYVAVVPKPIVEELKSKITATRRNCYVQMTSALKEVVKNLAVPKSKLKPAENKIYYYSLLRLIPTQFQEELGLKMQDLINREKMEPFIENLTAEQKNVLMRSIIFRYIGNIFEYGQTEESLDLQLLREFASQHNKAESEKLIAEHLEKMEKTQAKLEEQIRDLELRELRERAAEDEEAEGEPEIIIEPTAPAIVPIEPESPDNDPFLPMVPDEMIAEILPAA